jgi:HD-GYP domain-containing protein (c-di-GMP phosphodiesterase class II)
MLANVFHLMIDRLRVSNQSVVDILVRALEARGGETGSLRRVATAALALGERCGLSSTQRESLELGTLLHDIGEIRIPEALLQKSEPLTPEEQQMIEQHPIWGVEILQTVPLLTPALDVVGAHHKRYDGTGYPQGLRGEEVPLTARIFAIVDTVDILTHDRRNQRVHALSEALATLKVESGKQFDPRVVEAAMSIQEAEWAALLKL